MSKRKKKIIEEDAVGGACGAGSIAAFSMPLFSTIVKRSIPSSSSSIQLIKYKNPAIKKKKKKSIGLREAFFSAMSESLNSVPEDDSFDSADVIAKLKSLESKENTDYKNVSTFGLVDSKEQVVRITIPSEQAESFERDIQQYLGNRDESQRVPEIAEILFELKNKYTIINVEWPKIEEDEEEDQALADKKTNNKEEDNDKLDTEPGKPGLDKQEPLPAPVGNPTGDTGQVKDLLNQVIDMMKADADARKAEAQAREAEAKTKQANAARDQAMARVKQEEQFMDMDEYNKAEKNKNNEAKRLASLAKWKHDMKKSGGGKPLAQQPQYDFLPGDEDEEIQTSVLSKNKEIRGKVHPADVAKFILNRSL